MAYQACNYSGATPKAGEKDFTITVTAPTDAWRKPPTHDAFTAPIIYRPVQLGQFVSARVMVSAQWKTLYDQGGLMVVLPPKNGGSDGKKRWIKAGIEFYHGKPFMSVVACDLWADWALCPLPEDQGHVTIDIARLVEDGKKESVLVISMVDEKGVKTPVREITWAFWDCEGGEEAEIWVGAFAAKPTESGEDLDVKYEGFEIVTV